jgi:hypothetical protein
MIKTTKQRIKITYCDICEKKVNSKNPQKCEYCKIDICDKHSNEIQILQDVRSEHPEYLCPVCHKIAKPYYIRIDKIYKKEREDRLDELEKYEKRIKQIKYEFYQKLVQIEDNKAKKVDDIFEIIEQKCLENKNR